MENFKIESIYLKFCNDFETVIRYIKAAFYRPNYQKLSMFPLIKDSAQHLFQNMRPSLWKAQLSFWNIWPRFWGFKRKPKARMRVWKARPRICVITRSMLSQSTNGSSECHSRCFCQVRSPPWTKLQYADNWRENDMIYCSAKRWYILI